jgi:PHD/YefM family antitoxin component YafN of YafNO toxin-antitoxin module
VITIPAQDVKRRGIGAVDAFLAREPVHIIKNNQPMYVVLKEEDYQTMMEDLALARVEASENDLRSGQFRKGTVADLLQELDEAETP